ncbi:alpha-L-fucosidase [Gemmatimonas phototrophica]|uniref:alpha-L-fucosidase n=1 Tax=Gemmatimonas phototrophica TaxID=1379270 RepID=A0A143BQP9_9BACT|nr:alpha-L-fucosidase [Gemmatimonas phototrophica]
MQATPVALRPRPTAEQLVWQRDEVAMFVHFGVNTFTDREWGDGTESPALFNPTRLDARQWARAARAAGAKAMILTAKHHDGFCLWPTATTTHSVVSSPWKNGKGDVVREFVDACRAEGLKPGLYCSPWDQNHPTYGDTPRYNDVYIAQLTELLTNYGELQEVWFDGANGEGPNGKRQTYDWPRIWGLVRERQPRAVIFSDAGPDVRWIGNERGVAGETCWSTIRSSAVPYIGASGDDVIAALQQGHADGDVWRPGETDVSIRPGWFYHAAEDAQVRSVENLVSLYFTSVGRNSKLLLNVPPTREGLFHTTDVERLHGMAAALKALRTQRLLSAEGTGTALDAHRRVHALRVSSRTPITVLELGERIEQGQHITAWQLHEDRADGPVVASGTTIGYRQLRRIAPLRASRLFLITTSLDEPTPVMVNAYAG